MSVETKFRMLFDTSDLYDNLFHNYSILWGILKTVYI